MEEQRYLCYEDISNEIKKLYVDVNKFKQKRTDMANSFQQFSNDFANKKFSHPFSKIEEEINDVIGQWNPENSLEQLKIRLNEYFGKIGVIDAEISDIQKKRQKLLQAPDRHNRKAVTDKVDVFLKNVHTTPLAQLDRVKDDIIPKIHQMMNEVHKGFREENKKVKENEDNAKSLLSRIESYQKYVDKFGLYKTCTQAKKNAEEVLQTPNQANPDIDNVKLQKANAALDVCDAAFKKESDTYTKINSDLNNNKHLMWLGDYHKIYQILKDGATHNICSANQLEKMYADAVVLKKKELSQLLNGYDEKIKSFFKTDIEHITDNCVDRQELQQLKTRFDRKIAEDQKQLYFTIAKVVAGLIAFGAFAGVMWTYWPISGIILGVIVVIVLFLMFKD